MESQLAPFKTIALERFTGTEAEALSKLAFQLKNLESTISDVKKYSYVSTLSIYGSPYDMQGPVKLNTSISRLMEDLLSENKETHIITWKCDETAIAKYKQAIELDSNFPFSYYALAGCLRKQSNPAANEFAKKALEILKVTTTIAGHHLNHDQALEDIEKGF